MACGKPGMSLIPVDRCNKCILIFRFADSDLDIDLRTKNCRPKRAARGASNALDSSTRKGRSRNNNTTSATCDEVKSSPSNAAKRRGGHKVSILIIHIMIGSIKPEKRRRNHFIWLLCHCDVVSGMHRCLLGVPFCIDTLKAALPHFETDLLMKTRFFEIRPVNLLTLASVSHWPRVNIHFILQWETEAFPALFERVFQIRPLV